MTPRALGPTLSTLPLDVRDRILSSSPTRATLLALILTSRSAFYTPFTQHRTTIVFAVARNEVGSAFEYAKAAKRAVDDLGSPTLAAHKRIGAWVNDRASFYWEEEFYEEEFVRLSAVGRTGELAEVQYSIRYVPIPAHGKPGSNGRIVFYIQVVRIVFLPTLDFRRRRAFGFVKHFINAGLCTVFLTARRPARQ